MTSIIKVDQIEKTDGSSFGFGKVLQVVQQTYDAQISTTSTSYVTSNLAATITPTSANSKILINVSVGVYNPAGQYIRATVYRGSTELANDAKSGSNGANDAFIASSGSGSAWASSSINYLDSPSTTSATTYTLYYKSSSGTAYIHNGWTVSTLTLMEIAG